MKVKGQKPKYVITDPTGKLANRTGVQLELGWNIQPWVGAMLWSRDRDIGAWKAMEGGKSDKFDFPPLKGTAKVDTARGGESYRGKPHIG